MTKDSILNFCLELDKLLPCGESKEEKAKEIAVFCKYLYTNVCGIYKGNNYIETENINFLVIIINRLEILSTEELLIKELETLNLCLDTIRISLCTIIIENLILYNVSSYRDEKYKNNLKQFIQNIKTNKIYKTKQIGNCVNKEFISKFCSIQIQKFFVTNVFFDILIIFLLFINGT